MVNKETEIILVAAIDRNNAIGKEGKLCWSLPEDLKRFKELTLGKTVLMGRKTYESIGRALPGRRNLVLSTNPKWKAPDAEVYSTFESAIASCEGEVWVIGGSKVYERALPLAKSLEVTHVDIIIEGADAWFPVINEIATWNHVAEYFCEPDPESGLNYSFASYSKKLNKDSNEKN